MKNKYKLSDNHPNKIAFITGAGSGLGLNFCLKLAQDGWTIGMADINEERLEAARDKVLQAGGIPHTFVLDVSNKEQYKKVAADFLALTNGIDLLINNAGVADGNQFEDITLDTWEWIVGINQMGVIYGCHFFIPTMKLKKQGTIINIASSAAFVSAPGMASYNTSKIAVLGLSETLNAELHPDNINVSVVMPMFIRTNLAESSRGNLESIEVTKNLVEAAPHSPEKVTENILIKAGRKKFYIYGMKRAMLIHWMIRLFPGLMLRVRRFAASRREKIQDKVRVKHQRYFSKKK